MNDDLVLITGASSDIGVALIRSVLSRNSAAVVLAHSFSGGSKIASLQQEFGTGRVVSLTADLSHEASVLALAEQVKAHGTPRAFVHLPALRLRYDRATKLKWDRLAADLDVQVRAALLLLQALLPKMSKVEGARVLFILSSVTLGVPPKFMADYTIVKYAQLGLMRALSAEYATTKVRINAISPSMIDTQFVSEIPDVAREMSASSNPLGRNASVQDLLGAMLLLLGPESEYINGINLPLTGGAE